MGRTAGYGGSAMAQDDFETTWRTLNEALIAEMTAWRRAHPTATLLDIEHAVDSRMAEARARLVQNVAQASIAADWRPASEAEQPTCPLCTTRLRPNGTYTRHLTTQGDHVLPLDRTYGVCPDCGLGLFPPG